MRFRFLMLTARDALHDRLHGFDAGADDYLPKPFAFEELLARLRAIMRRAGGAPEDDRLVIGDLTLDRRAHDIVLATLPSLFRETGMIPRPVFGLRLRAGGRTRSRQHHPYTLGVTDDAYATTPVRRPCVSANRIA